MKKTVSNSILTLAAVVLCGLCVLTSCKKEEEDLLIGTWDLVKMQTTVSAVGTVTIDPMTITQEVNQTSVTFNSNGTWTSTSVNEKGKTENEKGTWNVKDGKLYIQSESVNPDDMLVNGMTIESLTAKELVLSYTEESSTEDDGVRYTGKVVMTFNKR